MYNKIPFDARVVFILKTLGIRYELIYDYTDNEKYIRTDYPKIKDVIRYAEYKEELRRIS